MAHMAVEILPEPKILPEGAITTARNIAQYPIELEIFLVVVDPQVRQMSCVIVDDEQGRRIKSTGLVGEHICTLHISIVGNTEALVLHLASLVQIFEDLNRLRTGSSTHVQH